MRRSHASAALALFASLAGLTAPRAANAGAPTVGVATGMDKVRPGSAVPTRTSANVSAAGNEFEPFQIVIGGGDAGVTNVQASVTDLLGPGGARIAASEITLYRVGLYDVTVPSNTEGAVGPWPDPLIPAVDTYYHEARNAFPFDVPANEARAIWVEVFVPAGTPRGNYTGRVTVSGAGLTPTDVPVTLTVRGFTLPPTATLRSTFGMNWDGGCIAHRGSYNACGDSGVEAFHQLYTRAALDHRITLNSIYAPPHTSADWDHFDAVYGALLDGTAPTRVPGARMTSLQAISNDATELAKWRAHLDAHGWYATLFHYTCDEPPATCQWTDIPTLAAAPRSANVSVLVTTNIDLATSHGLLDTLDVIVPVVNDMEDKNGSVRRADYDPFLSRDGNNALWWYQSCMSHGCGNGCVTTTDPYFTGWPSYVIDVSGVQNRAMEWMSYRFDISGELYFATQLHEDTAWADQCDFSGNGDGNLFYPGTPARVGGSDDIPIESVRLKLIREGMEDYEYLHLLDSLGDSAGAHQIAQTLFPHTYSAAQATPVDVLAARDELAARIESRLEASGDGGVATDAATVDVIPQGDSGGGASGWAVRRASGAVTVDGMLDEFAAADAVNLTVGGTGATLQARLLWDDANLYLAATVRDADLDTPQTTNDGELYLSDGVELLLDPTYSRSAATDATDRHVIVTASGAVLDAYGAGSTEDRTANLHVVTSARTAAGGYTIEAAIPWTALGVTPSAGLRLGGDVALNDARPNGAVATADWAGLSTYAQPARWGTLTLFDGPQGADGGVGGDAGTGMDGGPRADGAAGDSGGGGAVHPGGCGCRAAGGARESGVGWLVLAGAAAVVIRSRRRRGERGEE